MGSYLRPTAEAEALGALAAGLREGRPRVIVAGATDHYPARVGRVSDEDVLDISALAEDRAIRQVDGGWWIPALSTWTEVVEAALPPLFDGLRGAAKAVGGLQIQNRATVVGNLCNASPAADGVPNLLALD
ncbi:MAG: xanthine dehydrogenase family protein subunit, partial [Chloroflexi bacterium]|nr:xanthine dehydrogenase family protein subunit [Chloroflexota bacterium]